MAIPTPGDAARAHRRRVLKRELGELAPAYSDVYGVFTQLLGDLEVTNTNEMHTAALLTLAVVLHHQPYEEEM